MSSSKQFPLITSLAPKLSRLSSAGHEIGLVYQKYCVKSWLDNGFAVYSLNTAEEIEVLKHLYLDVHFIEAPRDGATVVGRPLVYISDMVAALKERGYRQCGIINSDIYIQDAQSLIGFLEKEIPGSCVFGHRVDIQTLGDKKGGAYTMGFDYFFMEVDRFDAEAFSPFLQGVPWWDYGLPLMMGLQGLRLKRFDSPTFFHLLHSQKWRADSWRAYYRIMRKMLGDVAMASIDAAALQAIPGIQGLRFLLGEGAFVFDFVAPPGDNTVADEAVDRYICGYAFYCLEMIAAMSEILRLPSEDGAEPGPTAPAYSRSSFEHALTHDLV